MFSQEICFRLVLDLGKLSTQIGLEWQSLGVHLGFSLVQMTQLRSAYPNSIPQCVSLMLSNWQITLEEYGIQTIPTLANALRDADRADLADDLSGTFQRLSADLSEKKRIQQQASIDSFDELDGLSGIKKRFIMI